MISLLASRIPQWESPKIGKCTQYAAYLDSDVEITPDRPVCVYASSQFVVFVDSSKPVTITGKSRNTLTEVEKDLGPVENGFLATSDDNTDCYFEISSKETQRAKVLATTFRTKNYDVTEGGITISNKYISVAIIKSDGQVDLTPSLLISNSDKKHETVEYKPVIFNPNGAEVKLNYQINKVNVQDPPSGIIKRASFSLAINFLGFAQEIKNPNEMEAKSTVEVKVKGKATTRPVVEQAFKLVPNTIYSKDDDNEALYPIVEAKAGGLSGGAIAGIVIAVVVAVAVIGFCVYWFVFRKKQTKISDESK